MSGDDGAAEASEREEGDRDSSPGKLLVKRACHYLLLGGGTKWNGGDPTASSPARRRYFFTETRGELPDL